ncbi:MAG: sulfite exporter TauE/SafE family protein [Stellaceae bacterium]
MPVLFEIFRVINVSDTVRMQLCVGTSLAIILPTALRSYRAHLKRGSVIAGIVPVWALPTITGVGVGSCVAAFAPASVFKIAFVIIAAIISSKLLFGGERWRFSDQLPSRQVMIGYGLAIGLGSIGQDFADAI